MADQWPTEADKQQAVALLGSLAIMCEKGSSVTLNWGEDTGMWECSWIIGGTRYTEASRWLGTAVTNTLHAALAGVLER